MSETIQRLRIKFENERPIELLEFTASLAAVGDEYRRITGNENGRLCIDRITEGSIDTFLTDAIAAAGSLMPLAPTAIHFFSERWVDALKTIADYGISKLADAKAKSLPRTTIKNAMTFAGPATKGNSIFINGDNNTVITGPSFNLDAATANSLVNNAQHLLAAMPVEEVRFTNEPLRLYQVRDAKKGDLGYIDRFSKSPKRLIFSDEAIKAEVLHGEAKPFDVFFFVSGLVKTAGGEIAGYHIDKIDGITDRDAA